MSSGRTRHLSNAYQDAALPSNDTFFAFDGTNSDLARQLYLRAKADGFASKFENLAVPKAVQNRLDDLKLKWDDLSGIAQRALLWDSGFAVTLDDKPVQIWTLTGHSMIDLAIPLVEVQAVGCIEMNCTQPDNSTSWSNLFCNGAQMISASRCVMEDFDDPIEIHGPMWMTGGNPKEVPTPRVRKHQWTDKIQYTVLCVHTVEDADEPAYSQCAKNYQNDGYGSLVLSCYSEADATEEINSLKEEPQGSPWVSRWLVEDFSGKTTSSSGGVKLAVIIPIVAGAVVVIALVVLFVVRKRKRKLNNGVDELENSLIHLETYRENNFKEDKPPESVFALDGFVSPTVDETLSVSHRGIDKTINFMRGTNSASDYDSGSNHTLQILLHSEFLAGKRIPFESLIFHKALSKGASGEVWLGEFQGQQVAIKRLLQAKTHCAEEVEEFAQEIELTSSLAHPNIALFIGVAWNSLTNLVMVLEFFPMGDVQKYLVKNADLLSWPRDKIHIAVGTAHALEYLHSRTPPLIHRDLKSKNILLTRNLEPKLIDFGVSRGREEFSMTAGVGTPYWTAPEVMEGKRYTEQADIYSFGVVLTELDTGKLPYHDALASDGKKQKPFLILSDVLAGMLRPSFSDACPPRIRRIGVACCQQDPTQRPTAAQVAKMLEEAD